jgi:hypothetical protein
MSTLQNKWAKLIHKAEFSIYFEAISQGNNTESQFGYYFFLDGNVKTSVL